MRYVRAWRRRCARQTHLRIGSGRVGEMRFPIRSRSGILADVNYNIWLARPDNPLSFLTVMPPFALPTSWAMEEFLDDMRRGLAGFASHTFDDDVRCCMKECTIFIDFVWAYIFNYATEVDQSLWPSGEVDVASLSRTTPSDMRIPCLSTRMLP